MIKKLRLFFRTSWPEVFSQRTFLRQKMRMAILALMSVFLGHPSFADLRIIDGDTIDLNGEIHRINGIDAPEHGQVCKTAKETNWPCGKQATELMAALVLNQIVTCETISKGRYGRSISTCRVGDIDLGAEMVRQGMAWAYIRFSDAYVAEEREARNSGSGIWQGHALPAWEYRKRAWQRAIETNFDDAPKGCIIKGNVSKNGKIYHTPWSPWYRRTKIDTAKGERWFCDEAEAKAAGWRAPYWK